MKKTVTNLINILLFGYFVYPGKTLAEDLGAKFQPLVPDAFSGFVPTGGQGLTAFLSQAFQFGLAIAAALAVVMIVWGGVEIMLSESVLKKSDGKQRVWDAIWGLLLALVSWMILWIINPEILRFKIGM